MIDEKLQVILDFLSANKCKDIALFNSSSDEEGYLVLATVSCQVENKKLADLFLSTFGSEIEPEGYSRGEWIIFDLGAIVLHTFIPTKREKYNLDKLYQNKKIHLEKSAKKSKK